MQNPKPLALQPLSYKCRSYTRAPTAIEGNARMHDMEYTADGPNQLHTVTAAHIASLTIHATTVTQVRLALRHSCDRST